MTAVAIGAFVWATSQHRLVLGMVLFITAAFSGMVAVFAAIRHVAQSHPRFRVSPAMSLVSGLASLAGLALVWQGLAVERQALTGVGVMVAIHGLAFLSDSFNQAVQPGTGATRQTWSVFLANAVMFVATLLVSIEGEFTPQAAFFTVVWLFALVVLKLTVVQFVVAEGEQQGRRVLLTWVSIVVALSLGAVALAIGGWFMLVWAGSLLVGGLSALGLLVHNGVALPPALGGAPLLASVLLLVPASFRERTRSMVTSVWVGGVVGGLVAVVSFLLFDRLMEGVWAPFALTVVVAIIGAFFVLPGETVFGLVLLGAGVVWVAEDTDASRPEVANEQIRLSDDATGTWVVALGDSFISGEGAPEFHAGTNSPGTNDCRRAPSAFPQLVGQQLGMQVMSFACSGATSVDLDDRAQKPNSPPGVAGGVAQIDALSAWLAADPAPVVDLAVVSIGGNDSGFGDVIEACLLPGANCADVEAAFGQRVATLAPRLGDVYRELLAVLESSGANGEAPRVMVTPYPDPIGPAGVDCSLVLSDVEAAFIRRFRAALNEQIATAAAAVEGVEYVRSERSLSGHELCAEEPHVNWLLLSPPDGEFFQAINPKNWINGSLHPGVGGHCVAALFVLDTWDAATAPDAFPGCRRPGGQEFAVGPIEAGHPALCLDGEEVQSGEDCTDAWNTRALANAGRSMILASAIALLAGLLLAGALSEHTPATVLRGPPASIWSVVRRVWLDYDKVAHGPRARGDAFSSPKIS